MSTTHHSTVLGHLARAFAPSPENLATEALAFVLERSGAARQALVGLAASIAPMPEGPLVFRTQAGQSDGAIPDLVAEDAYGSQPLILEAKFWAGLTDRQPVDYLKRLPEAGGLVLFVAPQKRFETLWPELRKRVVEASGSLSADSGMDDPRAATLGKGRVLGLVSWTALLRHLIAATDAAGERGHSADLQQLFGLCAAQDVQAFRPVSSGDLTDDLGERIVQWCRLVDDTVARAKAEGLFGRTATRAQGGDGYWGHYATLANGVVYLHFSPGKWARARATPLWLRILVYENGQLRHGLRFQDSLRSLALDDPPRLLVVDGHLEVPLSVPIGQEKDAVITDLLAQVRSVVELLTLTSTVHPSLDPGGFGATSTVTPPPIEAQSVS